ncbi:MAG: HlyD family efflux transporter periplasmic adaptor subunit, partial [Alphaproteobacteria bacterium]
MAMKPRTRALLGAGVAALAILAWVAFRPEPVPVDLVPVARGPMSVTVDADGKTRIRDVYRISAPVTGVARRSPVRVGDRVEAGQTIVAVIEPNPPALLDARSRYQAEAAVREAEANLNAARSLFRQRREELSFAESQYERAKALVEKGVASITEVESAAERLAIARAAFEAAIAQIDAARATLERARAALLEPEEAIARAGGSCCIEIKAPASGVVLEVEDISARPVVAGQFLLSIGDPAGLEVVADLLSADAVRLSPGAPATIERWGGPQPLAARLRRIEPAARTKISALGIEEQRVDAILDILSAADERPMLGHGFAAYVRISEWTGKDVVSVPLGALFRHDGGWAVYVVEDGHARLRPVETGHRNGVVAEIVSGLEPGEMVIAYPS